jgi:signal transduction histidine kinase
MGREPRKPSVAYLEQVLGVLPMVIAAIDDAGRIIWANAPTSRIAPLLLETRSIREALAGIAHEQKLDRLLIRHEVITCPGRTGGPDLHWMVWTEPLAGGEWVLMVWEADWSEEMNERRTAFTMAASHELRTPLTALLGFAEILEMDTDNLKPAQIEAVQMISETALHLTKLVDDVFELTSNSFGELRLNLERVDLGEIARVLVEAHLQEAANRGDTLTLEVQEDIPPVDADPARVRQMFANLVRNAMVHNPSGTRIVMKLWTDDDAVAVSVSDDGRGLPFSNPKQALSSFSQGDGGSGDRTGAGIGLTIAKRLIELHRGSIEVQSTFGEGSTFTLRFPIDRAKAISPGEPGPA